MLGTIYLYVDLDLRVTLSPKPEFGSKRLFKCGFLTPLEPHSRFGDKLLGIGVKSSPKREFGSKRLIKCEFSTLLEPRSHFGDTFKSTSKQFVRKNGSAVLQGVTQVWILKSLLLGDVYESSSSGS